jgi:ABC-type uncharacterized transport system ATPase subunit
LTAHRDIAVDAPSDTTLTITFDSRAVTSGQLIRDLATEIQLADIRIEETSAESVIRNLYEGRLQFDAEPINAQGAPA